MLNWVEIDAAAVRNNVAEFKRRLGPGPKLGAVVKSNDYGHGMIDAYESVLRAGELSGVRFAYPEGRPRTIDPDGGSTVRFDVFAGVKDVPKLATGKFYVDTGAGFVEGQVRILADNSYQGVFPTAPCDIVVKYYVTVEGETGKTYYSPPALICFSPNPSAAPNCIVS